MAKRTPPAPPASAGESSGPSSGKAGKEPPSFERDVQAILDSSNLPDVKRLCTALLRYR